MRTLIDIPDDQIQALARIGARERVSRAHLIRTAIAKMLKAETPGPTDDGFGLWRGGEDGLAYEDRIRAEW